MGAQIENVFIAWSGKQSKAVAKALCGWLPSVVQRAKPWMSESIDSGARWREEVNQRLRAIRVGVICLTPKNLKTPWLYFEAGALSRLEDQSRVTPYLIGLRTTDMVEPMPIFQAVGPSARHRAEALDRLRVGSSGHHGVAREYESARSKSPCNAGKGDREGTGILVRITGRAASHP